MQDAYHQQCKLSLLPFLRLGGWFDACTGKPVDRVQRVTNNLVYGYIWTEPP